MASFQFFAESRRAVSEDEAALIAVLLEREAPRLSKQIQHLTVVGQCGCGHCPSVFFELHTVGEGYEEVASYGGVDAFGAVGAVLFTTNGRLSHLDIYSLDGHKPLGLPLIASLYRLQAGEPNPTLQRTATPPLN